MPKKLNYDRDKVWQNIVKKQEREKKKKYFLVLFFLGLLCSGSWITFSLLKNNVEITSKQNTLSSIENHQSVKSTLQEPNVNESIIDQAIKEVTNDNKISDINIDQETNRNAQLKKEADENINANQDIQKNNNFESLAGNSNENINTPVVYSQSIPDANHTEEKPSKLKIKGVKEIQDIVLPLIVMADLTKRYSEISFTRDIVQINSIIEIPDNNDSKSRVYKCLFVENTLSVGAQIFDGPVDYIDSRKESETLNFVNSTYGGLEIRNQNNFLFRIGFNVDIVSHTYDHIQGDVISRDTQVQHDTAIVYINTVVSGLREAQEIGGGRHIVKNNEVIKFGLPIGIGYEWDLGKWQVRNYINARLDFSQSFSGVIKNVYGVHLLDQESTNNDFYNNYMAAKFSGQILFDRYINESIRFSFGLKYTAPEINLSNDVIYRHDYRGVGLSFGISTRL